MGTPQRQCRRYRLDGRVTITVFRSAGEFDLGPNIGALLGVNGVVCADRALTTIETRIAFSSLTLALLRAADHALWSFGWCQIRRSPGRRRSLGVAGRLSGPQKEHSADLNCLAVSSEIGVVFTSALKSPLRRKGFS